MSRVHMSGLAVAERSLAALEEALLGGRVDRIAPLERELQTALGHLPDGPIGAETRLRLARLRQHSARVGRLLQAARDGLRDAVAALDAPRGFTSYDASGHADQIGRPRARFERRR